MRCPECLQSSNFLSHFPYFHFFFLHHYLKNHIRYTSCVPVCALLLHTLLCYSLRQIYEMKEKSEFILLTQSKNRFIIIWSWLTVFLAHRKDFWLCHFSFGWESINHCFIVYCLFFTMQYLQQLIEFDFIYIAKCS